ncbi:hypothetical protein BFS06_11910 [Clostridium perfringens]|uniref:Uncharacterized protein n=1 Tax=Clostridium perfringens TaxID=1502 RepID=A0A140GS87_CLOPF|nr:hypothetical protein [Clostridium perfringens]AMN31396.1 hypothetical protein JFP838_pA0480 [Clostridium perfringens]TBX14907.1 hypothetical protein BFS06_11910 [Clostridium perfringens]
MINNVKNVEELESAIEKVKGIRQQAIAKRDVLVDNLKQENEELAKFDINPKEVEVELKNRENQINQLLSEINQLIPWDLIQGSNINQENRNGDIPF